MSQGKARGSSTVGKSDAEGVSLHLFQCIQSILTKSNTLLSQSPQQFHKANIEKVRRLFGEQMMLDDSSDDGPSTSGILSDASKDQPQFDWSGAAGNSLAVFRVRPLYENKHWYIQCNSSITSYFNSLYLQEVQTTVDDPNLGNACNILGSLGPLVAMAPAPFGPVLGIGMSVLGGLFGANTLNQNTILLQDIQNSLESIDERLTSLEYAMADLKVVMNELTALTQYNILVVEMTYQKLWVDPFHNIHRLVL